MISIIWLCCAEQRERKWRVQQCCAIWRLRCCHIHHAAIQRCQLLIIVTSCSIFDGAGICWRRPHLFSDELSLHVGKYRWPYLSLSCFHLPVYLLPAHSCRPSVRCRTHHHVTRKVAMLFVRGLHISYSFTRCLFFRLFHIIPVYTSTSGLTGSAGLGLGISANIRCDFYHNRVMQCYVRLCDHEPWVWITAIVSLRLRGLTVKLDW